MGIEPENFLDFVVNWIKTRFEYKIDDRKSIVDVQRRYIEVLHHHDFDLPIPWYKDRPISVDIKVCFFVSGTVNVDFSPLITTKLRWTIWKSRAFKWWVNKMAHNQWGVVPTNKEADIYGELLILPQAKHLDKDTLDRIIDDVWDKVEELEEIILKELIEEETVNAIITSHELTK